MGYPVLAPHHHEEESGFGSGNPDGSHVNSDWSTGPIWLRATFTLPDVSVNSLVLSPYHDEDVQIFLNGKPVFQEAAFVFNYETPSLTDDFKAALKPGKNVLAITCTNTDGPAYIDAGLAVSADFNATTLVGDARGAAPADWNYSTTDPGADWSKADFDATAWAIRTVERFRDRWPPGRGGSGRRRCALPSLAGYPRRRRIPVSLGIQEGYLARHPVETTLVPGFRSQGPEYWFQGVSCVIPPLSGIRVGEFPLSGRISVYRIGPYGYLLPRNVTVVREIPLL